MKPQQGTLQGINILDFSWAGAGPFVTRFLADFGAQVFKVESKKRPDVGRMTPPFKNNVRHPDGSALFIQTNTSKLSITLNIQHPKGIEIVKRLVGKVDIVMENFTPGVMARLGLTYNELKKIKPDIIMASSSIYGQTGPKTRFSGFGNSGTAISGHFMLTGWPDREPVSPGVAYADIVQPQFTMVAILAALDYRRRTGKGQLIDSTQVETMIQFISPAMLDYFANGNIETRQGNRSSYSSPHGVFPCKGEDRWCAIAVFDEQEWLSLCELMGNPAWCRDGNFESLSARKAHEDELESLIGAWTIRYDRDELFALLQEAGVTSGPVQDGSDLVDRDPQLRERQSFVRLTHPVVGECNHPTQPARLSDCPPQMKTSPRLGEHNEYVYKEFLGIGDEEYDALLKEGVFE
jgi:benzylsuccinate CoA-transferase BbsF subunit